LRRFHRLPDEFARLDVSRAASCRALGLT